MRNSLFIIIASFFCMTFAMPTYAQKERKNKKKDVIVMPEFPGGEKALHKFILSEVRYPLQAGVNNEVGEVPVGFFVGIDGYVGGVRVLKSVSESLDKEAVRVVKKTKYWTPGKKIGVPVRAEMSIPINFKVLINHNKSINHEEIVQNATDDDEKERMSY